MSESGINGALEKFGNKTEVGVITLSHSDVAPSGNSNVAWWECHFNLFLVTISNKWSAFYLHFEWKSKCNFILMKQQKLKFETDKETRQFLPRRQLFHQALPEDMLWMQFVCQSFQQSISSRHIHTDIMNVGIQTFYPLKIIQQNQNLWKIVHQNSFSIHHDKNEVKYYRKNWYSLQQFFFMFNTLCDNLWCGNRTTLC